jgi:hypothetical protein
MSLAEGLARLSIASSAKKEDVYSLFSPGSGSGLFTLDDSVSSVVGAEDVTLKAFAADVKPEKTSASDCFLVAQALLVEFRIRAPLGGIDEMAAGGSKGKGKKGKRIDSTALLPLPGSMLKTKELIREHIHINIAEYLALKRSGQTAYGVIQMVR